ncbi:MAG: DotU family type IV/VI secretion system protein [Desulfovibrionaceae bacterium]|nr:DotU family type IV/VI secretion system protein [Desulfovibrionaceae bacterium]
MKLYQACLPLLVFAGVFKDTPETATTPYDDVRSDVDHLLQQMRKQCADIPEKDYREALFAVCAFVDEALLTSSWTEKARWQARTLQRTFFGTVNAGVEFYDHLRSLLDESKPAAGQGEVVELTEILPESSFRRQEAGLAARVRDGIAGLCRKGTDLVRKGKRKKAGTAEKPWTTAILSASAGKVQDSGNTGPDVWSDLWKEDILTVYGACMAMGFKGQYFAKEQDALYAMTRESLVKGIGSRLTPGQKYFSPESYYMPESQGPRRHMPIAVRFVLAAIPIAITLALYMSYSHALSAFTSHWIKALGG